MLPIIARQRMHGLAGKLLRRVDLEVSPNLSSGTLSTGQRQLVEIARGLACEAKVFIFDEATSSLTTREATKLFEVINRLRQQGAAILYISHNLDEVLNLSDDVMVLRDGHVTLHQESKAMTAKDLVLAMVGRPIDSLFPQRAAARPEPTPVLEVEAMTELGVLRNVSLRVGRGEIVGIAGLMGSGRSEFARVVFGLDHYDAGVVRVLGNQLPPGDVPARLAVGMAFLTEDRRHEGLMMDASVADNMALAALPNFAHSLGKQIDRPRLSRAIRDLMTQLNVKSGDAKSTPVRSLSGGNQQKVVLGRWLLRNPSVFILDEPTRGVDIGAKQEIYRLLAQLADEGMAILVISSELEELIGTCDRIHVMRQGTLSAEFPREQFDREMLLRAAFGQSYAA
jgi:ribose transport system ATP-binding protein